VEPRLAAFKYAIEDAAQHTSILAGSGSSYAVLLGPDLDAAETISARVSKAVDGTVWLGRAPVPR
jgi:hypothetical protein